jgi:hypothetical protein
VTTSKGKSMKTLSLKLPLALERELEALARRRNTGKSAVVREALSRYLASGLPPAKGSFVELAGDRVGCVEGPADLSANMEHMEGFGQ